MLTCKACKPAAKHETSPHGFFRRLESSHMGETYYSIHYGKASELHVCQDRAEHAALWRKLCMLEATIIQIIGGEILNQW